MARTLGIAGLCALIPLAGNVAASFLTVWTGGRSWLAVPVVAVVVAMVTALVQAYGSAAAAGPEPRPPDTGPWRDDAPSYRRYGVEGERRGLPVPAVLLIAVLVLGVGGWAATQGVRYAVGYVTGNEPGTERLRGGPVSATAGGLTLTVESVSQTAHFTRVRIEAKNDTDSSMTLPLFKNCVFRGGDGTTLEADAFKSRWTEDLGPGGLQRGTVTFKGHIPDSVRRAELSFSHIFSFPSSTGFPDPGAPIQPPDLGPGSITVRDIRLRRL